jgi:hypothetical protein
MRRRDNAPVSEAAGAFDLPSAEPRIARNELARDDPIQFGRAAMTKFCFAFFLTGLAASLRGSLLLGSALAALCAGVAPAAAQTLGGNNFSPGSSPLSIGFKDSVPRFVILQEYDPSGPATTGSIFGSAGTLNNVSFCSAGNYDSTVVALALVARNAARSQRTFHVVGDKTFTGDGTTKGVENLADDFPVGAGDLAFAGISSYYPQVPNSAVGSDATCASSSEPRPTLEGAHLLMEKIQL